GGEGNGRTGGIAHTHALRHRNDEPRLHVEKIAGKAVDVEAHDATDILAKIVTTFAAGLASAASERAVHHHRVADLESADVRADSGNLAGGFGADNERQLALGEGHAAEAQEVEMVERTRLDADLHLARARRWGRGHVGKLQLAIADQGKRAHPSS